MIKNIVTDWQLLQYHRMIILSYIVSYIDIMNYLCNVTLHNIVNDETNYCARHRDVLESFKGQSVLSNEPNRLASFYNPDRYHDYPHD